VMQKTSRRAAQRVSRRKARRLLLRLAVQAEAQAEAQIAAAQQAARQKTWRAAALASEASSQIVVFAGSATVLPVTTEPAAEIQRPASPAQKQLPAQHLHLHVHVAHVEHVVPAPALLAAAAVVAYQSGMPWRSSGEQKLQAARQWRRSQAQLVPDLEDAWTARLMAAGWRR